MFADAFGVFLHIHTYILSMCVLEMRRTRAEYVPGLDTTPSTNFIPVYVLGHKVNFFIFSQIVKRDKNLLLQKQECSIDGM